MIWNVYREDFCTRDIIVYNVFNHGSFNDSVKKLMKKKLSKDDFAEALRKEVGYYFWCRSEYEITVCSSPTYVENDSVEKLIDERDKFKRDNGKYPCVSYVKLKSAQKIDISDQLHLNWEAFVDYVYSHR